MNDVHTIRARRKGASHRDLDGNGRWFTPFHTPPGIHRGCHEVMQCLWNRILCTAKAIQSCMYIKAINAIWKMHAAQNLRSETRSSMPWPRTKEQKNPTHSRLTHAESPRPKRDPLYPIMILYHPHPIQTSCRSTNSYSPFRRRHPNLHGLPPFFPFRPLRCPTPATMPQIHHKHTPTMPAARNPSAVNINQWSPIQKMNRASSPCQLLPMNVLKKLHGFAW